MRMRQCAARSESSGSTLGIMWHKSSVNTKKMAPRHVRTRTRHTRSRMPHCVALPLTLNRSRAQPRGAQSCGDRGDLTRSWIHDSFGHSSHVGHLGNKSNCAVQKAIVPLHVANQTISRRPLILLRTSIKCTLAFQSICFLLRSAPHIVWNQRACLRLCVNNSVL